MRVKNIYDSPTRTGISAHFHPTIESPDHEDELKKFYKGPIKSYAQFNKFPKIYAICPDDNSIDEGVYFCDICKRCNKISSTVSNVIRHAAVHDKAIKKEILLEKDKKRMVKIDEDLLSMTQGESKAVSKRLHKFFLLNGIPFNKIESDDLRSLSKNLMSRKELAEYSSVIANRVENKIISELMKAENISASFDGWTGMDTRHYLGVTIRCIIDKQLKWFTIDFMNIEEVTASAVEIGFLLTKSFREYGIIGRVRNVVSDSQAVMTCAATNIDICGNECILHILHTLIGAFIDSAKKLLQPLFKLASHLSSSTKWTAFANQRNVCAISSYTSIRWSSLLNTFQALEKAKPYIIEYSTMAKKEDKPIFDVDYTIISDLIKPLKIFQNWLEGFEGDEFGSQSDFLNAWYAINKAFQSIPNKRWNDAKKHMNEKKTELENKHKQTFEYLGVCAVLNPNTCLKNISEKDIKKYIQIIRDEIANIVLPTNDENKEEEELTREGFRSLISGDPLTQLYTRVCECPGNLFDYWLSKKDNIKTKALATVAMNYLSRLATSASTERLFSCSRRIQTFERVRLLPDTLRNLVLIVGNIDIADECFFD